MFWRKTHGIFIFDGMRIKVECIPKMGGYIVQGRQNRRSHSEGRMCFILVGTEKAIERVGPESLN